MKLSISVCLIVKNEESNIEDCLLSVKNVVKEIIVGDTGSTDSTGEIAKRHGAKVVEISWGNNFALARNILKSYANEPYILMLDADERLLNDQLFELQRYINSGTIKAGKINIENVINNNESTFNCITRLFPNNTDYKYVGSIHEQLNYKENVAESIPVGITLLHYGYSSEVISANGKLERNLNMLFELQRELGEDAYVQYQIGKTYFVSKDYVKSIIYLKKVLSLVPIVQHRSKPFVSSAYLTLCYALFYLKKFSDFNEYLDRALEFYPDYTDLYFIKGLAITIMNHPKALNLIPEAFEKCLQVGEANVEKYETSKGVGTFKAHFNLGVFREITGNISQATYHYKCAAENDYKPALERLRMLITKETL